MRIILIGNCQIRPFEHSLKLAGAHVSYKAIVHLLNALEEQALQEELYSADVIITQQISDSFRWPYVHTSRIIADYKDKTLVILNLFYQAYNPELCYVRLPKGTARGPLGDYHLLTLLEAWHKTGSVAEGLHNLSDAEYNAQRYSSALERTLIELTRREQTANVHIVEYILETQSHAKLFHTMNHPANILLHEYASRIARALDLNPPACGFQAPEHLGAFQLPTNPVARSGLKLAFNDRKNYSGLALGPTGEPTKTAKVYEADTLCEAYQRVYDSMDSALNEWCAKTFGS